MKFILKTFIVLFILLVAGASVYGYVAFSKNKDAKWETVVEKSQVLLTSTQNMRLTLEASLPGIKVNLDKLAGVESPLVSAYREFYETSETLAEKLRLNEKLIEDLLAAAQNKDYKKVESLYGQLKDDVNGVNEWTAKHKEISGKVKELR